MLLLVGFAVGAAEPTQTFTDDLNRKVVVPVHPKRIVSLHDLDITIPLIELGVPPVASHGRTRPDGSHFLRSSGMLTGVDFDNSDIKFIGTADIDIEAIAAAKPDLIVTEPTRNTPVEQLAKIAPTVSIDHLDGGAPEIYRKLAQLTGTQARQDILERRYQEQIKALKATIDTGKVTVSVIQANQGKINAMHSYHSLGRVLRDAGFKFPPLIESIPEGGRIDVSAERLPELDADFVFATWRGDTGGKPQDELAAMDAVMPGWCQADGRAGAVADCRASAAGGVTVIRKEKGRVDVYGDRFRARAHQLTPRLLQVARYIHDNREAVMEQTAMEIATLLKTSDATVVRAIQALGFAGLRDLKQTLEQWFGPVVTSSEKMSTTVNTLASDVNASIDFVLEGHQHTCEVLSEPHNRYAMAQAVSLLAQARQVAIFGIGASGILAEYTARLFSRMGLPATPLNRTGIGLAEQLIALQRGDVLVMMAQKSAHREGQTTLREAKRLGIPTILLTNALDSRFSKEASVVIHVPRGGEKGKIPLHGTVLLCLEMIILSVASTEPQRTIKSMKRINELHRGLKPGKKST
ncbi:hypothetical protein L1887_44170 [Cichorium endivia]|nr:hypothetical protein L1887_44170 [Cichorium endivia]